MATNPNEPRTPEELARVAVREKYQRIIDELWTNQPDECPICKSTAWSIADLVQTPVRPLADDLLGLEVRTPQVYVYVPVTCLLCGYTRFFHSGVLDIRDAEEVKARQPLHLPRDQR